MKALTLKELTILDMYVCEGLHYREIAKKYRINRSTVGCVLFDVAQKLEVDGTFKLCLYWTCPLFRLGLRELGLLPGSKRKSNYGESFNALSYPPESVTPVSGGNTQCSL